MCAVFVERGHIMKRLMTICLSSLGALVALLLVAPRARTADVPTRYLVPGDGTVHDTKTDLAWEQTQAVRQTWMQAKARCAALLLPGTGWRLPTIKELQTLVDFSRSSPPLLDLTVFPAVAPDAGTFWSSTRAPADIPTGNEQAWTLYFNSFGATQPNWTVVSAAVRCVR
jgi:Protein of unknown function (DUF1566)